MDVEPVRVQSAVSNAASLIPGATDTANIEERGEKKNPTLLFNGRAAGLSVTPLLQYSCVPVCACAFVYCGNANFCTHGDKTGGLPAA